MKKENATPERGKLLMRTYLTSLLSLLLCVTMLLGTTYAWFTSEVTTAGNEIYVGTLKVDMVNAAGNSLANAGGLFGSGAVKWEPGATQIETVKVVNHGDLAFDYALYLSTVGAEVGDLNKVGKYIDVYVTANGASAANAQDLKEKWIRVGTLADTARNGFILANGSWKPGQEDVLDTIKIALHMPDEVSNTDIMGKRIKNLGIRLMATQKVYETDDFGGKYDESAPVDALISTYAELATAVNAGQSVRMTADITVPENTTLTVASGKKVVIDMNGFDINATSSGTGGNRELFLVKGNLIIKGQKSDEATVAEGTDPYKSTITYTHVGEVNMGWSHMTSLFDITAGGSATLLDVKAVNAGGTDMNFVAHLNNWGTASLYMDGAHLEAPYCAIRVFNSGNDMNNVVAKNTTITGENRALWVHNYAAADFSSGYNAKAVEDRLNISILNGNNKINGDIRYGFNETTYHVLNATAFNSAMEKGASAIVLQRDVNVGESSFTIKEGKSFTLNLNGHNLTASQKPGADVGTLAAVFVINNGAKMTVEGKGNVVLNSQSNGNTNVAMPIFRNQGELTINDGNFEVNDTTVKVDGAMVIATIVDTCLYSGEATTTINGGTFQVKGAAKNIFRNYPTGAGATCKLIINDGTFLKNPAQTTYIWNQQNSADSKTFMTFNGGQYDGVVYEDYFGQTDIKVTDAAVTGGLTACPDNN